MPRRLYLSNETDKAILLRVDTTSATDKGGIKSSLKDSINGKLIEAGHVVIIYFGNGRWNASDEESLKDLLRHVTVITDAGAHSFGLPKNISVGHGIFIPELIVKIYEPNPIY